MQNQPCLSSLIVFSFAIQTIREYILAPGKLWDQPRPQLIANMRVRVSPSQGYSVTLTSRLVCTSRHLSYLYLHAAQAFSAVHGRVAVRLLRTPWDAPPTPSAPLGIYPHANATLPSTRLPRTWLMRTRPPSWL